MSNLLDNNLFLRKQGVLIMNKIESQAQLYHEIETLREQMHHSIAPDKINNQETHRISQKLDKLILKVMMY